MLSEKLRFQIRKGRIRARLLKYTRKAFRMLPKLDKPRILDTGCGSGVPTIELARISNGFIVVHDEKGNVKEKLEQIPICGYELIGYFMLNEDVWWFEYLAPLEKLISETGAKYADGPNILEALHEARREIDMFKKNPQVDSSVFFIMRKR